jgi:Rps23 Pro-64 3,4-dihydroxylase Tpa1-like proline 4-hydroxylase
MKSPAASERIISFAALSRRRASAFAASARRYPGWTESSVVNSRNRGYADPTHRNCLVAPLSALPELALVWETKVVPAAQEIAVSHYGASGLEPTTAEIIHYHPGGFFKPHRDSYPNSETSRRVLTLILYLNDNFTGGRTLFQELEHTETPAAGSCLIFHSRLVHSGEAIQSGSKIAVVGMLAKPPARTSASRIR